MRAAFYRDRLIWTAAVLIAALSVWVLLRAGLDAIAPMRGYMHPSGVGLWHAWIAIVLGAGVLTGAGLRRLWRGRLGRRWRGFLVLAVSFLAWPLALLAGVGLGARTGALGFLVGSAGTLAMSGFLLWQLVRFGTPMGPLSALAAIVAGVVLGLCALVVEFLLWYSVSAVFL